jgi:peptidoglycan/xylan/chitin deacetylase (PgdA/CDA1 family)
MKRSVFIMLILFISAAEVFADNVTFCYHKFSYDMDDIYSTLPDVLEWQIEYIKEHNIPIIRINDLVNDYTGKKDPGQNILLTADDGWKSDIDIKSILDRQQVPMTLYLYPQAIRPGRDSSLNPDDVHALMKDKWVEYGCHSYSHSIMTKLNDEQLEHEAAGSKAALEDMLGVTINTFAYPYGILNRKVEKYCRDYYSIIFGVNDGANSLKTDRYNLNRFVIYRNTTFGEFMNMCEYIKGAKRDRAFSVRDIGESDEYGKRILFPRVKYYKFKPVSDRGGNVLFVPGSYIGAGWNHKTLKLLLDKGIRAGAVVNRNNNIPFYRPEKNTMKVIQNWGMKAYMDDMVKALDYILTQEDKTVIVTWGDGFDLVMAVLGSTDKYNTKIRGLIVVNPTFSEVDGSKDVYRKNVEDYNKKLAAGEHAAETMEYYLKIKTLSDMVLIKPDAVSVFTKRMGYKGAMTNKELLENVLNDDDHPDLGIDYNHSEYTLDDFKKAFMQPVPLFSMVVPVAYLRDLNDLWLNDFVSDELGVVDAKSVSLPVSYIYSDSYADSVKKEKETFKGLKEVSELPLDGISTIEIMLSDNAAAFISGEAEKMLK